MASVYILVNKDMPGLIKIGHTSSAASERAKKLSQSTSVPSPFEVVYETPLIMTKLYFGDNLEILRELGDKRVHLMCTNPPLTKECLMIDKKVELTNEDIQSIFDRMFSTGKVQHRRDLVNAVKEAYSNLSPYYSELVGSETWKTRLYDKCNVVLNSYKNEGKVRRVGRGEWQSTAVKFK